MNSRFMISPLTRNVSNTICEFFRQWQNDTDKVPIKGREGTTMKTPWHLWVVGILGALWTSGGCFDYVMTATKNEAYFAKFDEDVREFFMTLPAWYMGLYAIPVWGGLLGCVLLLFRMKLAALVLLISFIATVISFIWYLFIADTPESLTMNAGQWAFTAAILVISAFLVWYSRRMAAVGVLK